MYRKSLFFIVAIFLLSCQNHAWQAAVPTRDEVGAEVLPEAIAPVTAPFDMPRLEKPYFPDTSVCITAYGACTDKTATEAINRAIADLSAVGGGRVIVPAGVWRTGRVMLRSNVNLHLTEGAELHFSGDIIDYLPAVFTRQEGVEVISLGALVYADGEENIALTGKGRLVGPARDCEIQRRQMRGAVIENLIDPATPVAQRLYDGRDGGGVFLPMFVSPIRCRNVYIEGVTLENTPFWNIVPVYCDGVIIRGVTVRSVGIPRGDGIDIESSRNVLIEYCTLSCGDDCFTMKAGRCEDGMRVNQPTENVVVRYCLAEEGHGGITCGSETAGTIRNLYLHDCVFDGTGAGIRFKTRRNRGGGGEHITYERIRMTLRNQPFVWDMLGSKTFVGELAERLPARDITPLTPSYRHITARDIIVEECDQFIKAIGIPEIPLSDVSIENVQAHSKRLIRMQDVKNFSLTNVEISSIDSLFSLSECENVRLKNVKFTLPGGHLRVEDPEKEYLGEYPKMENVFTIPL